MELDKLVEAYGQLVEEVGVLAASDLANRLFRSRSMALALAIILRDGKATAVDLSDLGVPEASAYRCLAELRRMDVIIPGEGFQASPRGGPRTKPWYLRNSR